MIEELAIWGASGLLFLGIILWLRSEFEKKYAPPRTRVPSEVYRLLEKIRDSLFGGSDKVRLTAFTVDPDAADYLLPYARIGWGRPSSESTVRFKRNEGMCGMAANSPGGILVARIGPYGDREKARKAHKKLFNLDDAVAEQLSDNQLDSVVLIAASLMHGRWLKGVLCVDSKDPALIPLDPESRFWNRLDYLTAELARAVKVQVLARADQKTLNTVDGSHLDEVKIKAVPTQASIAFPAPRSAVPA